MNKKLIASAVLAMLSGVVDAQTYSAVIIPPTTTTAPATQSKTISIGDGVATALVTAGVPQSGAISIGFNGAGRATTASSNAVGIGSGTQATGTNSLALGPYATSAGLSSIAAGERANATDFAIGLGNNAAASGYGSFAGGAGAISSGDSSVALGRASSATAGNSVALGAFSTTDSRANQVSVGSAGNTRLITNVSSAQLGTDATNLSDVTGIAAVTLGSANAYTNVAFSNAVRAAGQYTDAVALQSIATAAGYSDSVALQAVATSAGYTDAVALQTLTSATSYTDGVAVNTLASAASYTDHEVARASIETLRQANAYTDAAVGGINKHLGEIDRHVDAANAMSAAQSNIIYNPWGSQYQLGVGAGYAGSAVALSLKAMGSSADRTKMFSFGASLPNTGSVSVGGGVSFNW